MNHVEPKLTVQIVVSLPSHMPTTRPGKMTLQASSSGRSQ